MSIAGGLLVSGVGSYVFLIVAARRVGPQGYAALSVLWAMTFLGAFSVVVPLQQEVARAVAMRRAHGQGWGPVLRRSGIAGAAGVGLTSAAAVAAERPLVARLFDGDGLLLAGFILAMVGYGAVYVVYGVLAGTARFRAYAVLLAAEGAVRLGGCVLLAVAGVTSPGYYGLVLGAAPGLALAATLTRLRLRPQPGPPAHWRELSASLGTLLVASVLSQALINGPPLAVKLLAAPGEEERAGAFLAGLIAARVPLFLFAAVQAALLPGLTTLAARRAWTEFAASLRRLGALVAALVAAMVAGAASVGPPVVRLLFGRRFDLGGADLAALAGASGAYIAALVMAQALIALRAQSWTVAGWAAGVAAFAVALVPRAQLLSRVEVAFVAGTLAATLVLTALTVIRLHGEASTERSR